MYETDGYNEDYYTWTVYILATYTHTIIYDANGGSGTMSETTITDLNSGYTNVTFASNGFTAPTGYYFAGWRISNTGTVYQPGDTYPVLANSASYAYAYWAQIHGTCGDNLTWSIDDNGRLSISGTGAMYEFQSTSPPWYQYRDQITSLSLPEGLTTISRIAFFECMALTGPLTIPSTVTSIGFSAFDECGGLTGPLVLPAALTTIGDYAFFNCSGFTGPLTIPPGVTSIGEYAFAYCSGLTGSLTIPGGVTAIGDYAFVDCTGFDGTLTISNGVTSIGLGAFLGCTGFTGALVIPGSVTTIGGYSFSGCRGFNGTLTISSGVTTVGGGAFYQCTGFFGSLILPDTVTAVGSEAFTLCTNLTGLTISRGMTALDTYTFSFCSRITSLEIPDNITTIGAHAFYQCTGLTGTVTIPESVTTIGAGAFRGCSRITKLIIPSEVTSIGESAFRACYSLTEIIAAAVPATIGSNAFSLGTSTQSTTCTVKSLNNIADGAFDSYTDAYTTFVYSAIYMITVSSGGNGSVSGGGLYDYGATVTLTATPDTYYTFQRWQDDDTTNPRSITVTGNAAYTAYFEQVCLVKVNVDGTWVQGVVFVNANGTWERAKKIYVNMNNTWEEARG